MILSNEWLLNTKKYSKDEIQKAALIIHPNIKWYNIKLNEIFILFEEWSNFTQLENPIIDDFGNEFWDSEWYYMSLRSNDQEIKKIIAFMSIWYWLATKARQLYQLDSNIIKRMWYMRKAVYSKFDNNPDLRKKLLDTWDSEIIEYTFWDDVLFWINQDKLEWCNVLWKLLMEYRQNIMNNII